MSRPRSHGPRTRYPDRDGLHDGATRLSSAVDVMMGRVDKSRLPKRYTIPSWLRHSFCRCAVTLSAIGALCPAFAAAPASIVTVPRVTHPGSGQTFYFVLPDRFANGSAANDTGGISGGPDDHGFDTTRITHYHGGDFVGLVGRLDYLKNLGVTAIWVTPPFRNQPVRQKSGGSMAAHHGYWILDFLQVDPHLGTNEEFFAFVEQCHHRGIRVFLDIVVNHTADVIRYEGDASYLDLDSAPYRDSTGTPLDVRAVAYNGVNVQDAFPPLSSEHSFPLRPFVPAALADAKNPAWLNDVSLYHNRGDATKSSGESALFGDFRGLDGVFTEHPRVVHGFIDVFRHWIETYRVDGFRIDTVRHVNAEFWQAFAPAIRARARELGRIDFLQFGEVANEAGGAAVLSEFSTGTIPLDATLDFGFFAAARQFVAAGGSSTAMVDFFASDDYYTDHDSNVHSTTTFLGNHDAGRFAYFLQRQNPASTPPQLEALVKLGYGLLYLVRGQPVLYYGDEQGMIGRGGDHEWAREDMFAAQAPEYHDAPLLGTTRTGADDKFDETHPFYHLLRQLGSLRLDHAALRTGAMIPRATEEAGVFAFSRIDRGEQIEYLVALNKSRSATLNARVPTSQPAGAAMARVFDSRTPAEPGVGALAADEDGMVDVSLDPLQFAVWRATSAVPVPDAAPHIAMVAPASGATLRFRTREVDGLEFSTREELHAEVTGGDGIAEVTFSMTRASRPGQYEYLGTDDAAPYRVFWSPPPDLAPGEELAFIATVNDLRGHRAAVQVERVTIDSDGIAHGIRGAKVPQILRAPPETVDIAPGETRGLEVEADGTGPIEYQWLHDDGEIAGATHACLQLKGEATAAGRYAVLVRNRAGTVVSRQTCVRIRP